MKTGIAVGDIHYPYENKKAIKILFDIAKDVDPDYFIGIGDFLDMNMISVYSNNKPRRIENQTLHKDYEGFQKNILDPLENILKPDCKKVFIYGNHEDRINNYLDYYPTVRGVIEPENNLELSDWKIIPYRQHYKLGNTIFTHGIYHNQFHAKKHLDTYGCNIIYGHLHTHQVYTRQTPVDNDPITSMSLPCMCNLNPHYAKDLPNKWENGFLVFYKDGKYQYNNVISIKGKSQPKTYFNGVLYG